MSNVLIACYTPHIERIEQLMLQELGHWPWESAPELKDMAERYLSRKGKRLRPLLALLFTDLFNGQCEKSYAAAAAIELYHTATLIYDDIQDNSEFRRGLPCAHVTTSTSMAMNLAGTIRSLMYHILHRATELTPEERLEIHRSIDEAATHVSLGQSIDIGWHENWYPHYQDYPYEQMIIWKSASLFGCAARIGAYSTGADLPTIQVAEHIGTEIGVLFQKVDDYLDIFGKPEIMRRPLFNDLREGKLTYPILILLDKLFDASEHAIIARVLESLSERDATQENWQWLVQLMEEFGTHQYLIGAFEQQISQLRKQIASLGSNLDARRCLDAFLELITIHVCSFFRPSGN